MSEILFTSDGSGLSSFKFVLEGAENSGKTIFAPDERARIKLYPGGQAPDLSVTYGRAAVFLKDQPQIYTEYVAFKGSESGSVTYHINSLISATWEGAGSGRPRVYGSRLVLPEKTTGVMKVTYQTSYDLIDITCSKATYIMVSASAEGLYGDFLIDYTDGYTTGVYEKDVVLTVKDACTRESLSDAHVYINDTYQGKSDSEGIIRLGSMKTGTYALRITKTGYTDTDKDTIKNDYFTVE